MPCDVLGMEPGWHAHAYSCSYTWRPERFPQPEKMLTDLRDREFDVNLWEHAFIHPASPMFEDMKPYAGDIAIWQGLIPDLSIPEAREQFGRFHQEAFVENGISGFKLDECDNSDFMAFPWSFPEHTRFPGGMDGEQMHSMFGSLFQRTISSLFKKMGRRTLSQVRSSHAFAAPQPFVLYSDLYDHRDFLRGVVNSGFSGLLWTPEVRQCASVEDLYRRIQSVLLSPMAQINAWMIPHPPWKQVDAEKNRAGDFMADWQEVQNNIRALYRQRMQLLPYIYSAFIQYQREGIPPFRALILDFPGDVEVQEIDDQWMLGPDCMSVPLIAGEEKRRAYFPETDWDHYKTGRKMPMGGQEVSCSMDSLPLYVREGALLPLADPVPFITTETVFDITVIGFGSNPKDLTLWFDTGKYSEQD